MASGWGPRKDKLTPQPPEPGTVGSFGNRRDDMDADRSPAWSRVAECAEKKPEPREDSRGMGPEAPEASPGQGPCLGARPAPAGSKESRGVSPSAPSRPGLPRRSRWSRGGKAERSGGAGGAGPAGRRGTCRGVGRDRAGGHLGQLVDEVLLLHDLQFQEVHVPLVLALVQVVQGARSSYDASPLSLKTKQSAGRWGERRPAKGSSVLPATRRPSGPVTRPAPITGPVWEGRSQAGPYHLYVLLSDKL